MLDSSDERYLLNKLYIDDFCVWLQRGAVEGAGHWASMVGGAQIIPYRVL